MTAPMDIAIWPRLGSSKMRQIGGTKAIASPVFRACASMGLRKSNKLPHSLATRGATAGGDGSRSLDISTAATTPIATSAVRKKAKFNASLGSSSAPSITITAVIPPSSHA